LAQRRRAGHPLHTSLPGDPYCGGVPEHHPAALQVAAAPLHKTHAPPTAPVNSVHRSSTAHLQPAHSCAWFANGFTNSMLKLRRQQGWRQSHQLLEPASATAHRISTAAAVQHGSTQMVDRSWSAANVRAATHNPSRNWLTAKTESVRRTGMILNIRTLHTCSSL
jgi:hypothetical protein